ncbi:hypothetical protein [Streptomyces sp. NPDC058371]|uniref:hypothetical protein n=1 Tax=Streptomyces sp. NPDC058371 TaxID=3346463 RepID=UPI00364D1A45
MAWDWDAYFNSGNRPKSAPRQRVAPPRAPQLRLVRPMNWDAYFGSGSTPRLERQGRGGKARMHGVRGASGSAT